MRWGNSFKKLAILAAVVVFALYHWSRTILHLSSISINQFFDPVIDNLVHAPSLKDTYIIKAKQFGINDDHDFLRLYLSSCLLVPDSTKEELTLKHKNYVKYLFSSENTVDAYAPVRKGTKAWNDYKGKNGIVYIGGGKYSWISFLSIVQLRKTGSKTPVEVFIPSIEEYDQKFCEEILPQYNAHCLVFKDPFLGKRRLQLTGYQYKMLALLMSSYENTMYVDSDVNPLHNPDFLFTSELYRKNGLLLWPDHWARTTSPDFYDIVGIDVREKKVRHSHKDLKKDPVPPLSEGTFQNSDFHDFENTIPNPTVEAGVLLVNKSTHVRTLQLALYYNVLGPDFYYPLLTQGGAGEGDKDTFNAAAHVLDEPYHLCAKQFRWIGYHNKDKDAFDAKGLGIHDPVGALADEKNAKVLFIHCSYPKYFPGTVAPELAYSTGEHIRMYDNVNENVGYDVDLRLMENFAKYFCKNYKAAGVQSKYEETWAGTFLPYVKEEYTQFEATCEELFLPHLEWLRKETKYRNTNKHGSL